MSMEGKIALVTGGARGIGRAISETLAQRGAEVVIADRLLEQAETTAQEIASLTGKRTLAVAVDVAEHASAKAMVERALGEFGRVDILVNNAELLAITC
jgi:NAD(P)-dependent dehydrogenase (short-subunit alcohol dehydrogenase family)